MSKSDQILDILDRIHGRGTALTFRELRLGSGYSGVAERRVDYFKIEPAPSKGYVATAYEIKISRSDFRRDIANAKKQRGARLFADQFYFVAPPKLLTVEEIPDWAGLLEIDPNDEKRWPNCDRIVPAPRLDKAHPTWGLLISAVRNSNQLELAALRDKVMRLELALAERQAA